MNPHFRNGAIVLGVALSVLAIGLGAGVQTTGDVTNETTTSTPTATATPTQTATPTPAETTTPTSTEAGAPELKVVTEQWEDKVQVAVLGGAVPEDIVRFKVRGATLDSELDPADSQPATRGTLNGDSIEVVAVYDDGSTAVVYAEQFD